MPEVITANRLTDGIVVYLAPDGSWVEDLAHARVAVTEDEIKALESEAAKAVAERRVVATYPMAVAVEDGIPVSAFRARAHSRRAPHHTDEGLVRCTAMTSSITPSSANACPNSASRLSAGSPAS